MQANRRRFLKAMLAAGAAPWVIPAGVVRAQDGAPTPSNKTTFALIGTGSQGTGGMKQVLKNPAAQVIATCDVSKGRRERGAKLVDDTYKAAGCAAYGDFRELLARKDLDCVEVATGDHWHIPLALAAVRAGKDVYVEKPLGVSMRWAYILREEVQRRKAVFQFGTQQRSTGHFRKACEMVRNGLIGEVKRVEVWSHGLSTDHGGIFNEGSTMRNLHVNGLKPSPVPADLDYDLWQGPAPARVHTDVRLMNHGIFHISDYALGYIAGWGIHPLDIAQWGLDADDAPPVSYQGTGRFPDTVGLFDTLAAWDVQYRYASGVEVHFMDWLTAQPIVKAYRPENDHGTTFFGEKGWISVDRHSLRTSDATVDWRKLEWGEKDVKLYASQGNQFDNFIACVKSRGPTVNPIGSAVNDDLICHLSSIAARTGREIKWDPKAEQIVGDTEAALLLDRTPRAPWKVEREVQG
ncbi:MAG: Gfo/Idh/MocA family oxidoreductase [Verrucomicrobiota bacterium]|jgi:predicted dehydrogenase|nr:Gfo/Idh/MocA family oxidoreductase [Verrucomicrobiota bacterium]